MNFIKDKLKWLRENKVIKKVVNLSGGFFYKLTVIFKEIQNKCLIFLKQKLRRVKGFFPNKKYSLKRMVELEKKHDGNIQQILQKKSEPIWIPSLHSFFIILGGVTLFWILAHPQYMLESIIVPFKNLLYIFFGEYSVFQGVLSFFREIVAELRNWNIPIIDMDENHYQNFITVYAGIGAVLIGLAFFVAQSLTDKSDPERGRVLLYKSLFFPLLTGEILAFFLFLWGDMNIFAILPAIILGLVTIWALGRTIDILLKDHEMEKAKRKMFFEILRKNFVKILDFEITKRIGNNKLYAVGEIIQKENPGLLEITPFGAVFKKGYVQIKSLHVGTIVDVSLLRLENLMLEIRDIAFQNKEFNFDFDNIEETNQTSAQPRQDPVSYLLPRFQDNISTETVLFEIQEDLLKDNPKKEKLVKKLTEMVNDIFSIKPFLEVEKEARLEISKLKDRCIRSILNQEIGELEKIVNLYVDLTKEFFGYLKPYGGGFPKDDAEKERTSIFDRLTPVVWLSRDIREIFEKGMESDDVNIIREIAYLPIVLAKQAMEHKDHLIFREFIIFPQLLYSHAYEKWKAGKEKLALFMFDRTWRYLKEFSDYYLESKFKDDDFSVDDFNDFAVYILKIFQSLLKAALDNNDKENFDLFVTKCSSLFRHLVNSYNRFESDEGEKIFDFLNEKRQQIFFGLASWILFQLESDRENPDLLASWNTIKNKFPNDLKELTNLFIGAHSFDVEDFWGWGNWELKETDGEFAQGINVLEKLEKTYAVLTLNLLRSKTDDEISNMELPPSRDLAFLAEGTRDLLKIIDDIAANPDSWSYVLLQNAASKTDKFKELLNKARKAQDESDLEKKRNASLSLDKIEKLKEGVVKTFYDTPKIRDILKMHGLLSDKSSEKYIGEIKKLGINTIFDKAPFLDDSVLPHIHFIGVENGFDFGRSMARGEDVSVLNKIKSKTTLINKEDFEGKLASFKKLSDVLILAINNSTWKFFEEDRKLSKYIPKWQNDGVAGVYKLNKTEIPVYELYDDTKEPSVIILSVKQLGKMVQYSPLSIDDEASLKRDIFHIDVQEFAPDSDLMNEFIGKPPEWLGKLGSDHEKQKEYLQERVLIHIFERFEFELSEDFTGFFFTI